MRGAGPGRTAGRGSLNLAGIEVGRHGGTESQQMAAGQDADRPANGGRRVRRRRAGDHPGISRPLRSAGRAARRLRRLARRQQRLLHQGGRQAVRTGGQGVPQAGRGHSNAAASVHRLLGVEPLSRRRGIRAAGRSISTIRRAAGGRSASTNSSGVTAASRSRSSPARNSSSKGDGPAPSRAGPAALDLQGRARLRDPGRAGAGDPQPGHGRVSARVHRRDPGSRATTTGSSRCSWPWC